MANYPPFPTDQVPGFHFKLTARGLHYVIAEGNGFYRTTFHFYLHLVRTPTTGQWHETSLVGHLGSYTRKSFTKLSNPVCRYVREAYLPPILTHLATPAFAEILSYAEAIRRMIRRDQLNKEIEKLTTSLMNAHTELAELNT
jgi:hypothetical protein